MWLFIKKIWKYRHQSFPWGAAKHYIGLGQSWCGKGQHCGVWTTMAGTVMILQPGLRHLWVRTDVYNPVLDLVGGISGADHVGCIGNGSCQFCEAADWERHDHEPLLDNFSSGTALQYSNTHLPLAGSFCLSYKQISLVLLTINHLYFPA